MTSPATATPKGIAALRERQLVQRQRLGAFVRVLGPDPDGIIIGRGADAAYSSEFNPERDRLAAGEHFRLAVVDSRAIVTGISENATYVTVPANP